MLRHEVKAFAEAGHRDDIGPLSVTATVDAALPAFSFVLVLSTNALTTKLAFAGASVTSI